MRVFGSLSRLHTLAGNSCICPRILSAANTTKPMTTQPHRQWLLRPITREGAGRTRNRAVLKRIDDDGVPDSRAFRSCQAASRHDANVLDLGSTLSRLKGGAAN